MKATRGLVAFTGWRWNISARVKRNLSTAASEGSSGDDPSEAVEGGGVHDLSITHAMNTWIPQER
jgi:hypothetical protein